MWTGLTRQLNVIKSHIKAGDVRACLSTPTAHIYQARALLESLIFEWVVIHVEKQYTIDFEAINRDFVGVIG